MEFLWEEQDGGWRGKWVVTVGQRWQESLRLTSCLLISWDSVVERSMMWSWERSRFSSGRLIIFKVFDKESSLYDCCQGISSLNSNVNWTAEGAKFLVGPRALHSLFSAVKILAESLSSRKLPQPKLLLSRSEDHTERAQSWNITVERIVLLNVAISVLYFMGEKDSLSS